MKFRVYSAAYDWSRDLHEHYPALMKYGHEFEIKSFDSNGKAKGINYIYLYSLEELINLMDELNISIKDHYNSGIVLDRDNDDKELVIYIHDDYLE